MSVANHALLPQSSVTFSCTFRFRINLQCSAEIEILTDVALQITVNLLESSVSINWMRRGSWNDALTITGVELPCEERFVVAITCDYTWYKVSINNHNICEFPQKISYDRVTHLVIAGDIIIERISYEMESTAPSYQANSLAAASSPLPYGFKYTEGPPPSYNDIQPKGYLQNVNYGACPVPMRSGGMASYATGPTFTAAIPGQKPYAIQEIYPSPSGTMIPLNTASSNFEPVPRSNVKKYIAYGCCISFAIVIILAGLLTKSSKSHHYQHFRVDHGYDQDY